MSAQPTVALIVAAGSGRRFGSDLPKQYHLLGHSSILRQSVLAFMRHPDIDKVCVVYHPDFDKEYQQAVGDLDILPPICGGATRQESVRLGLESLTNLAPASILIHDAARSFVCSEIITNVLGAIDKTIGAVPCVAVNDTLKRCDSDTITHTVDRSSIMMAQTPQGFLYNNILQAHRLHKEGAFTDDSALFEASGYQVKMVEGSVDNFKITTQSDLIRARHMYYGKKSHVKTGMGFDVHAFDASNEIQFIRLCGVDIPSNHTLKGHSDADVGLHALVDALLGAIGEGDIGDHFPPSDPSFKGADSALFVEKAILLLAKHNATLNNADITLICEQPKISPFKHAMKHRVATLLNISAQQVNIKATTTEKLGFTGRGEGIAAQAIITITQEVL